jgi:antitoxin component YwqK of YwqJK toxin-antitoxin module
MKYLILIVLMFCSTLSFSQTKNKVIKYYPDGSIEEIRYFDNRSRRVGEWIRYYDNGKINGIAYFEKGKKTGMWKTYDFDGKLIYVTSFSNNKRVNVFHWSESSGLVVKN